MNSKNLIICGNNTLFKILKEIKDVIKFELISVSEDNLSKLKSYKLQEKGFGEEYLPWFRPNQKHETNVSLFYPEKLDFRDGKGVQYEITSDNISITSCNF